MNLYLVLTMRTPAFDSAVLESHYAHLDALKTQGGLEAFGPFTDKSGGAYLLRADSLEQAQAMAFADPVHLTGSSRVSVHEWAITRVFQGEAA